MTGPDFRVLFESAPGLYLVLLPDFRIVAVSDAYLQATMTSRDAILGKGIFEVFPDNPDDPTATGERNLRESLQRVLASRRADSMAVQKYDIRRPASEGGGFEERYWSPVNSPVAGVAGEVLYIIDRVEDVTEFVRLKQKGQERERVAEALRARAGQMESEVYVRAQQLSEANRQLRTANESLERLYRQIAELMAHVDDKLRTPDVASRPGERGQHPIAPPEMLMRIADLIERRQQMEEQLRQSQKMEALGRLAGGVAHDFNNLLTVITGFARMVMDELPPGELAEYVEEIDRASARAASLVAQLLTFSRKQVLQPKVLDVNEVVAGMKELLGRLIGEHIALVTSHSGGICTVKADRTQVEQVIMNLAVNARDAMPNGGRLSIETGCVHVGLDAPNSLRPGPYVVLSVGDSGVGMDAETVSHIFEPFFTTKDVGKGTGLGLSTVYGIADQSGGTVTVESTPAEGSVFRVFLPLAASRIEDEDIAHPGVRHGSYTGTVLLVEDETPLRKLVSRVLTGSRFHVLEAAHGQDALRLAAECAQPIDILLSDVLMPGMSGPELMDRLRQSRPEMLVLFMSGYDKELLGQRGADPMVRFVPKPFTPQALLAAVHELVGGAGLDPPG
jgi:signal transduction histidine kinase